MYAFATLTAIESGALSEPCSAWDTAGAQQKSADDIALLVKTSRCREVTYLSLSVRAQPVFPLALSEDKAKDGRFETAAGVR